MTRVSLDSNILIYAEGTDDIVKRDVILALVGRIGFSRLVMTMQAAGETMNWLLRKGRIGRQEAVGRINRWFLQANAAPVSTAAFKAACELTVVHQLQLWDAVVVTASAEAGANVLLSEDMQHGFSWGGITIINPFLLTEKQRLEIFPKDTLH